MGYMSYIYHLTAHINFNTLISILVSAKEGIMQICKDITQYQIHLRLLKCIKVATIKTTINRLDSNNVKIVSNL